LQPHPTHTHTHTPAVTPDTYSHIKLYSSVHVMLNLLNVNVFKKEFIHNQFCSKYTVHSREMKGDCDVSLQIQTNLREDVHFPIVNIITSLSTHFIRTQTTSL